ncbi:prefoldin subunit beta [Candidatus Woesearchaeota archaeon CG10_big_fil_rev_8_21_14_0_10_45_16]|nr:MAG: prefoldin subunit beta [Candidatus Woesearchaeota archaeon CG10_big_fil_rev_8_21_14_0_10_45_16]
MASANVSQLQLLQQNLESIQLQKQQLQSQLVELDSAVSELSSTEKSYRIIGKIMVAASKDKLQKELQEKKDMVKIRLNNFSKQEEKIKQNLQEAQKAVMEEMKKDGQ